MWASSWCCFCWFSCHFPWPFVKFTHSLNGSLACIPPRRKKLDLLMSSLGEWFCFYSIICCLNDAHFLFFSSYTLRFLLLLSENFQHYCRLIIVAIFQHWPSSKMKKVTGRNCGRGPNFPTPHTQLTG